MTSSTHKWDKLSPREFQQLQELASYSSRKLQDVLQEFCAPNASPRFNPDGDIDFDSFRRFLDAFLDCETPPDLAKHLFVSFLKPNVTQTQLHGKALNQMAAISSTAACAPVTAHTKGSIPNINSIAEITTTMPQIDSGTTTTTARQTFVEKIHGITDKLHSLGGHLTHDASKTGSVHPMVTVTPSPLAGGPSIFQTAPTSNTATSSSAVARRSIDSSPSHSQTNHSQMSRNSSKKSNNSVNCKIDADIKLLTRKLSHFDPLTLKVPLKDVVCYLSLLEAGRPADKLEFMFRLYDTDGNGVLDTAEMDAIVNQMMAVAEYLGWDVSELRPILQEMMIEIDYDADGTVSLEEWQRGGLTTIPLLVLLGIDSTALKEDGMHVWRLKHFKKPAYCNLCLNMLVGLGKKGLCCVLCKYTVHERCVQHAPASCITTYVKSKKTKGGGALLHHWVEGNCYGHCSKCRKRIKAYHGITGLTCRWCHMMLHNRCASSVKKECTLGEHAELILPPTAICPAVLDRQRSVNQASKATHFQITLPDDLSCPLLVFVNPKSGGRQGDRILRKFQYMLNPRQVYDLSKGGPKEGLTLFKDLPNFKVICCGGDGTVGWVLEAMDSIELASQPAIGVIPLGTGNDLARCLRWGGGYEGENIPKLMDKIKRSSVVMLDRWSIEVTNSPVLEEISKPKVTLHSNMQKVFELSQSVIVEKSFIERFEEIHRSTSVTTNMFRDAAAFKDDSDSNGRRTTATATTTSIATTRPAAAGPRAIRSGTTANINASTTSMSSSITATTTEYNMNDDSTYGDMMGSVSFIAGCSGFMDGGRSSANTYGRTTKSISMSTFETKRLKTALASTLSNDSCISRDIADSDQIGSTGYHRDGDNNKGANEAADDNCDANDDADDDEDDDDDDDRNNVCHKTNLEPHREQEEKSGLYSENIDENVDVRQKDLVSRTVDLNAMSTTNAAVDTIAELINVQQPTNPNHGKPNDSNYGDNTNNSNIHLSKSISSYTIENENIIQNENSINPTKNNNNNNNSNLNNSNNNTSSNNKIELSSIQSQLPRTGLSLDLEDVNCCFTTFNSPPHSAMNAGSSSSGSGLPMSATAKETPWSTVASHHKPAVGGIALNSATTPTSGGGIVKTPTSPLVTPTSATSSGTAMTNKIFNIPIQQPAAPIKVQVDKDCTVPYNIINNYFSVGVDAAICVKFHLEREKNPHKFNSRMKNKLWYFEYATSETFAASCKNLHENIEIVCDGVSLDLANGPHLQGVALLNIPYTHGGSNLWGEHLSQKRIRKSAGPFRKGKKLKASEKELSATSFNSVDLSVAIQDIGDRLIEVIGLENCLHMGQVRTGLRASGRRLAQCSEVIIKTKKTFPMQIDGEPWMQVPCTIKVSHKNQVPMLMAPRSEKGRGFFNLLCS